MRRLFLSAVSLGLLLSCERAAPPTETNPIDVQTITHADPPLRAVVARIDLSDPRVEIVVCSGGPDPDDTGPWETILRAPSDIARDNNLELAINGGFFAHQAMAGDPTKYSAGDPGRSMEAVVIDGHRMTASSAGYAIAISASGGATIGDASQLLLSNPRYLLAGPAHIVEAGKAIVEWDDLPAPHTAAGLSADGKTLILFVVDGRRPDHSIGMTARELSREMARLGAYSAISLDGGGSSAIAQKNTDGRYRVLNRPSDGSTLPMKLSVERPVPYVLGVRVRRADAYSAH